MFQSGARSRCPQKTPRSRDRLHDAGDAVDARDAVRGGGASKKESFTSFADADGRARGVDDDGRRGR